MPANLLDEAKKVYKDKNYNTTVSLLSTFLASKKHAIDIQVEALDLRCQAYTKLGEHDSALKDARHMIHVSKKQSPIGYLRCSQIEKNSGNFEAAIKWLEHGCKNAPQSRPILESQLEKVKQLIQMNVPFCKQRDPIETVPLEVLQLLLTFFDYREIVILLRVSKKWKNLLLNLQPLRTTIDFSGVKRKVTPQGMNAAINRLCRFPKHIHFESLSYPAVKIARKWLTHFPHLEAVETLYVNGIEMGLSELQLHRLPQVRKLVVETLESRESVFDIICASPSLQEVSLCGLHAINVVRYTSPLIGSRILHLHLHHNHDDLPLGYFPLDLVPIHFFPNLQTLSIIGAITLLDSTIDLSNHRSLTKLILGLCDRGPKLNLPVSLQELSCELLSKHSTLSHAFEIAEPVDLRNLHSILLRDPGALEVMYALERSESPPSLQNVTIRDVSQPMLNSFALEDCKIFAECHKLSFTSGHMVDRDSLYLTRLFPAIEVLTLNAPHVTGAFVSDLARTYQQLRRVALIDCAGVSADTKPWLESRGIECRVYNSTSSTKDARRVHDYY